MFSGKVGIVGAGLIGRKRASVLPKTLQLVGVFELKEDLAENFANDFNCHQYSSIEELIERVGRNGLLIIAVSHNWLTRYSHQALESGLHVLVEKPGGVSSVELKSAGLFAQQNDLVLRVGYNHRFHPSVIACKQAVESRKFGEIQLIRARYGHGGRSGYEKEWRAKRALSGGGELLDQGSHLLDLARFFGGDIELNFADIPTLYWDMEVEDNAFISASFPNGGRAWLHASWTEWKNTFSLEIFFKTAKFEINGLGGSYGIEKLFIYEMPGGLGIPNLTEHNYPNEDDSWSLELADVLEHASLMQMYKHVGADWQDGVRILEIVEKVYGA